MENGMVEHGAWRAGAFVAGLGVGTLIGILFAPQSGRETRDLISRKADEGMDYAQRKAQDVRDRAQSLVDRGKQAVSRQRESISQAVEAGREAYRAEMPNS
jgi:gas vesicle protein